MVGYASKELFKKEPVAWQIYDLRLANFDTDADFKEELSRLLASPILYLNGHDAPDLSGKQIELLRAYIDKGGFIFAEDCCGKPGFAEGFRKLVDKLFDKENSLVELRPNHPIWAAHTAIDSKDFYRGQDPKSRVQYVERDCRTVLVFTPIPLAGYWEEARFMPKNPGAANRGELAFRFAGNVIAYATELKMPKPNGSRVDVGIERDTGMKITSLTPCGPAAQAGLRVGDIIVRVGSSRIRTSMRCVAFLGVSIVKFVLCSSAARAVRKRDCSCRLRRG